MGGVELSGPCIQSQAHAELGNVLERPDELRKTQMLFLFYKLTRTLSSLRYRYL